MSIPEQPFGFVAGRWVLSLADTPMDSDRAPDYKPLYPGSVIFNNKLSHRVVTDGSETVGIVKTRYEASLNEEGRIIDAEAHEFVALPVGVYSVTFSFGQYSWPNFDIEVKAEHTIDSPLWLPSKSPIPAGPGIVHVVSEEARLAAEAAAVSAWAAVDTPGRQGIQGIQGPPGDLDTEHLAGAPRLTNLVHDKTWSTSSATIHSQIARTVEFTVTAQHGYIHANTYMLTTNVYYLMAEVKATSPGVFFGSSYAPTFHSGSGDWERLSTRVNPPSIGNFLVRDGRSSGWDQIEVRDPVLIDLTAVFGAGREPTKEHMDALMAKHGNYIGVVDQFAFGDALQALTVAGPGMTLRHDNSAGTRVFLDHPGGSTMIHGDTDWRTLTSWDAEGNITGQELALASSPTPETPGWIRIRREMNTVVVAFVGLTIQPGSRLFLILPTGFGPGTSSRAMGTRVPIQVGDTIGLATTAGDRLWVKLPETAETATTPTTVRMSATAWWPTTLPGEPV